MSGCAVVAFRSMTDVVEIAARAESEGVANGEGEGEQLGRVLRRSLSLNPNHVAAGESLSHFMRAFSSPR